MRTGTLKLIALAAVLVLSVALPAPGQAIPFTIGNATPTSIFFVQGQSFTPAVAGNIGAGSPPASGIVFLDDFTIAYAPTSVPFASLYIYSSLPTVADASTGAGSLASGTHIGGGVYDFSAVALDVNTKYYAVLPGSSEIFDGDGNPYTGGVDLFDRPVEDGQLDEGFGDFDIGFRATFQVPIPATAMLLLLGLAGLSFSRRRRL